MSVKFNSILCAAAWVLAATTSAYAQDADATPAATKEVDAKVAKFREVFNKIEWKKDGEGMLGQLATIKIPDGYRYTGAAGTIKLMEAYGNLTSGAELGYIAPLDLGWFAVFEFENSGYVKDDEKNQLDADQILQQLRQGQVEANKELAKRGMPTLEVLGWQTPPFYNPQTHNLEWAIRLHGSDGSSIMNYKTKILGRRGVMDVVLVCDEKQMAATVTAYQQLLQGFAYRKEHSYAAFTQGDKVAAYGLTGLIVGGGLLAAAKTGLLAKLWKPLVAGVVAIGAFLKRLIVGKKKEAV